MIAGQGEVRTDNKAISAADEGADVAFFVVAKRVAASTDAKLTLLAKQKVGPRGTRKQSREFSCTGSATSCTDSQP
jgi:hypothetical protein